MERNDRLTILRLLNGLTQDMLAARSGLPRGSLSIWEKGNNAPSHQAVPRLASALNVPPGYLMYGSPQLDAAVWQPTVPAPRHFPQFEKEVTNKLPAFCEENHITRYAYYQGWDGRVIFLGKLNCPYSFLILQKQELDSSISKALNTLKKYEINSTEFYDPPLTIGFLENMDIEHLMRFMRIAYNDEIEVDSDAITSQFIKVKQSLRLMTASDTKYFRENTFYHLNLVLEEFEKPPTYLSKDISPNYHSVLNNLSIIHERLYEEIERKSLIWNGLLNDDLANMVRIFLRAQGYKDKVPTQ